MQMLAQHPQQQPQHQMLCQIPQQPQRQMLCQIPQQPQEGPRKVLLMQPLHPRALLKKGGRHLVLACSLTWQRGQQQLGPMAAVLSCYMVFP